MSNPMKVGIALRNMGPGSSADLLRYSALRAEDLGLATLWVTDHIAIPPDDAEGSQGRYTDPLTTLAWLAGCTTRIGLGTAVLILPYREPLPTAKAVATVQELSGQRLQLGVGLGWMEAEFRALGRKRSDRVRDSHQCLRFLRACFSNDVVEAHGQSFIFKPRPMPPPILMGGAPPHAWRRALRFADGWMPMGLNPERLAPELSSYRAAAEALGLAAPKVVVVGGLPLAAKQARDQALAYANLGVDEWAVARRYEDRPGLRSLIDAAADLAASL